MVRVLCVRNRRVSGGERWWCCGPAFMGLEVVLPPKERFVGGETRWFEEECESEERESEWVHLIEGNAAVGLLAFQVQ